MNVVPNKTEFTEAEFDELRRDVKAAQQRLAIAQAEIGRQSEVPESTLSQFLSGSYTSEPGRTQVAQKLVRWLKGLQQAAEVRRLMPKRPAFRDLEGSRRIRAILGYARETARLVMVAGAPGVSKTASARQFKEDNPRTWYAVMDATTAGVQPMLLEILAAMGTPEVKGTPMQLMRMVCAKAAEAKGLLIIDEGQHLSDKAIETLRAINDRVEVGIAILGNEGVYNQVGTTGTKASFAQVSSRFAHRSYILEPDAADAAQLAKAWAEENGEVITAREVTFCQQIAAKHGGLRNIEMTFEKALIAARGAREALGLEHLQGAFTQLAGTNR